MGLNIAICDDSLQTAQQIYNAVCKWADESGTEAAAEVFHSAEELLFHGKTFFQIYLLDIEMPGINGMQLAKRIRTYDERAQIIFITGYSEFAAQGYDVAALHYLLKPVQTERLFEVLNRAVAALQQQPRQLLLPVEGQTVRVQASDVLYAESSGHYVVLYTAQEEYRMRMTIARAEELLGEGFFRCSRSFVVGLRYVQRVAKNVVVLTNGTQLPLGRGMYEDVNHALVQYIRSI